MKNIKKIAAGFIAVAAMATSITAISASAANEGEITINTSSATLYNHTNQARWGTIYYIVYDRDTDAQVDINSNGGIIPGTGNSSISVASPGSYSTAYYKFVAIGQLHYGTAYQSPVLWSDSKTY